MRRGHKGPDVLRRGREAESERNRGHCQYALETAGLLLGLDEERIRGLVRENNRAFGHWKLTGLALSEARAGASGARRTSGFRA